ncbi:hypothetical protein B0T10DRAFT_553603 [Thelonectria olida]|uniref:Zn(2)-C6 fungal-type domain-containing protein n=1 Tax=Thelonectria olida TaxID=1576542 RepID=A0A9P8VQN5_9HYPO|nr:hypothetical protein B0T10DRAFT_553603 [Thelonectria olida]
METAGSLDRTHSLAPAPKRRKLRNGTTSCWECKRRKARCSLARTDDSVCDGCKRRGTPCISQDLPDQPARDGSNRQLIDRLGQVEAVVDRLLQAAHDNRLPSDSERPPSTSHDRGDATLRLESPVARPLRTATAPAAPDVHQFPRPSRSDDASSNTVEEQRQAHTSTHRATINPSSAPALTEKDTHSSGLYDCVRRELLVAWPTQRDLDIILSVPVEICSVIRGLTYTLPDSSTDLVPSSPQNVLQLPPPGSHPVLIAQKLLVLGAYLQGLPSSSLGYLKHLSISRQDIMSRIVERVHNLVTCNDELVASLEGIECIMLEALYESYAGNLRRSWLASRRAVTMAQMLGLHRGVKPTSLLGATLNPDNVWFRLIQLDRYLSMMLGLPQTSLDESFARLEVLEPCVAMERMQRLNCVAAGRLLQRAPGDFYDSAMTKEIDKLLADASESLPAQWWVPPALSSCNGRLDMIHEKARFNGHFMHYHLLVHLHLPYLLSQESGRECEYNRMTAIAASREILTRHLSYRAFHYTGCYCRGVDLLAFIASTALGIAHICDRRRHGKDDSSFHFLAHQRLSDRGLLEHTLQSMREIAQPSGDTIATTVATLLEHLLLIEKDVAAGGYYKVTSFPEPRNEDEPGYSVKLSDDGAVLHIYLPHIRVIKIERAHPPSESLPTGANRSTIISPKHCLSPLQPGREHERAPTSTGEGEVNNMSTSPMWQNQSSAQLITPTQDDSHNHPQGSDGELSQFLMSDQLFNAIEGSFQDVDVAFFDSLI